MTPKYRVTLTFDAIDPWWPGGHPPEWPDAASFALLALNGAGLARIGVESAELRVVPWSPIAASHRAFIRSLDQARERLEAAAVALELAAREDGTGGTDTEHGAAECAIWEAGIAYGEVLLEQPPSSSFVPEKAILRHRDCMCGAAVPEIANACGRCGGMILGAPLLDGSAADAFLDRLRDDCLRATS